MTLPTTLLAYQDCQELLDRALADDHGIRMKVDNYDAATHERSRIHYCRKLVREENCTIYEPGDPMYAKSVYDCVVVRIKNIAGEFYLYLERNDKIRGKVESLSEIESEPEAEAPAIEVARRV